MIEHEGKYVEAVCADCGKVGEVKDVFCLRCGGNVALITMDKPSPLSKAVARIGTDRGYRKFVLG